MTSILSMQFANGKERRNEVWSMLDSSNWNVVASLPVCEPLTRVRSFMLESMSASRVSRLVELQWEDGEGGSLIFIFIRRSRMAIRREERNALSRAITGQ